MGHEGRINPSDPAGLLMAQASQAGRYEAEFANARAVAENFGQRGPRPALAGQQPVKPIKPGGQPRRLRLPAMAGQVSGAPEFGGG